MNVKIEVSTSDFLELLMHHQSYVRSNEEWQAFNRVADIIRDIDNPEYPIMPIKITLNKYERKKKATQKG